MILHPQKTIPLPEIPFHEIPAFHDSGYLPKEYEAAYKIPVFFHLIKRYVPDRNE